MQKKYYSINEVLNLLGKYGLTVDTVSGLTREKIIHPIIYVDSLPAHACESGDDGRALAVGHCFLSAYWDLGNEMIAIVDGLIRDGSVMIRPLIKREHLVGLPEIFSWQCDDYVFKRVPPGHAQPKPFSDELNIQYFVLIPETGQNITLKMTNLLFSSKDFEALKLFLDCEINSLNLSCENNNGNIKRSEKCNPILDLIKNIHVSATDKTPRAVWNELKMLCDNDHPILQEVSQWTDDDAKIEWKSHRKKERSMKRSRFENIISELNNPK